MNQQSKWPETAVVALIADGNKLLTIKRSEHVRAPGEYCFPGGGIEMGESNEAAIRREMLEELNVEVDPISLVWQSTSPSGVKLDWWHVKIRSNQTIVPNFEEVAECNWLTLGEIRQLPRLLASNIKFLDAHDRGEFQLGFMGE